jgi:DNA-binding NarL/FixJ family response regulator
MDRSKVAAPGADVDFVRDPARLDGDADVIVVDLGRPGGLDAVRALRAAGSGALVVAFGRHTEREVLAEAGAAGCDRVLARSAFFADVAAAMQP